MKHNILIRKGSGTYSRLLELIRDRLVDLEYL
jgi:hypothetical protein